MWGTNNIQFWYRISTMVIIYLVMIQSFREGLFDAYKSSLVVIMPWDSLIIDGSMFVHCHQPVKETFAEYANEFSGINIQYCKELQPCWHCIWWVQAWQFEIVYSKITWRRKKKQSFTIQQSAKKLERIFEKQPQQNRIVYTSSKEYILNWRRRCLCHHTEQFHIK